MNVAPNARGESLQRESKRGSFGGKTDDDGRERELRNSALCSSLYVFYRVCQAAVCSVPREE